MDGQANDFTTVFLSREEQTRRLSLLLEAAVGAYSGEPSVGKSLRALLPSELQTLRCTCRCNCGEWSKLYLLVNANDVDRDWSSSLAKLLSDTRFDGHVIFDMDENDGGP